MKIEIDFSRPDELAKTKRELEMALTTIESALVAIGRNGHDAAQPSLPNIATNPPNGDAGGDTRVNALIGELATRFTMREAISAGNAADIPPTRLRREIARRVETGSLVLIQRGGGRRPASFRKA